MKNPFWHSEKSRDKNASWNYQTKKLGSEHPSYQWIFQVPVKGGIGSIWGPQKARSTYKWYILPIGGLTMPPTTFYGNQKQPLKLETFEHRGNLGTPQCHVSPKK